MQVVFLFDLNAFNGESVESARDLQRQLLCLRLACLRILTHYSTTVSNLKWGFKFFDSKGSLTQAMQNFSFPNVSLESFEILENEICTKYQRHISYLEALAAASNQNETISTDEDNFKSNQINNKVIHPVQLLHLALTQILYEYQWNDCIDMFSPSTRKRAHTNVQKKNLLFFISKCASNNVEFQAYFGADCSAMTVSKFTSILLSQSLNKPLLDKASILWIWLNTSENSSFLGNSKPSCLMIVANTLKSLKCALIPLCVLSELNYILKLKRKHGGQVTEILQRDVAYSPLVPFSSSFSHSVSYPFYLEKQAPSDEAEFSFGQNNIKFPVSITQVPVQWNQGRKGFNPETNIGKKDRKSDEMKMDDNENVPMIWSKLTAQFAVSRNIHLKTDNMLLLLPSVSDKLYSYHNLRDLIKSLILKDNNLLMVCESVCGLIVPAVFTPLSDSSAVISILDPEICFLNKVDFQRFETKSSEALNFIEFKKELTLRACDTMINQNSNEQFLENSLCSESKSLKPFQMESIEDWFEPISSVTTSLQEIQQPFKCALEMQPFQDKLRAFYKSCKSHKKEFSEIAKKELPESKSCPEQAEKLEEIEETYKDVSYEQLISILNDTYNSALKSSGSVLHSAKKIIRLASNFFLKKSIISYEDSMKSFMAEYFCLTCRKVIEKYKSNPDEDASVKKINECQLQAILALEMEVLFPSTDGSSCADSVRSFLGVVSFNSSSNDHNKFLCEVLKENYSHNLYNVLLEIGGEIMMPEEDSLESETEDHLLGPMSDPLNSVISSTLSVRSASSTSSRSDNRKLIKKRSDISDTTKSRQVLLPVKSPKRKKAKGGCFSEKNAIRYSPRLASKKKRSKFKTVDSKPETARRNLFPRDRKPHTPRTSSVRTPRKKKTQTPKPYHVLKTNFVPETPTHKQQRRKSRMHITSPGLEVGESPVISKNSQGGNILNRVQKLRQNSMSSNAKQENSTTSASCSFQLNRTPENNRRLSLKLFSSPNLLTSPTARMGLKKCSKRLFPIKDSDALKDRPSKRIKLEDNFERQNVKDHSREKHTPKKRAPEERDPSLR